MVNCFINKPLDGQSTGQKVCFVFFVFLILEAISSGYEISNEKGGKKSSEINSTGIKFMAD